MSQQINLFNPVFARQGKLFSTARLVQGLAGLLLISGLFCAFLYNDLRQKQAQFEEFELKQQQMLIQQQKLGIAAPKSKKVLEAELAQLNKDDAAAAVQAKAMTEKLGNTQGYAAYFSAFSRQTPEELWLTGFEIDGQGESAFVRMTGGARYPELVAHYLKRLGDEPVFQGVKLESFTLGEGMAGGAAYLNFELRTAGKEAAK
jgi:Tfp pilus assembly protein PilN